MSRKPIVRELPELRKVFSKFQPFSKDDNKRQLVENHLRKAISSLRGSSNVPFYSMRDIATFFDVSLKTVALVFRNLQKEGLLSVVRGSQTLIESKQKRSRHNIKGVIGIPIPLPSFIIGNNPRAFYIRLEEELRRHGYVADFIFYRSEETFQSGLLERLLQHNLDLLFWLCPTKAAADIILTLQDAGVRIIAISNRNRSPILHQYRLDLDWGTKEAAVGWRNVGIREVVVISPSKSRDSRQMHEPVPAFQAEGIKSRHLACGTDEFFEKVKNHHADAATGYIFVEHEQYESLCNYDWRAMEAFFQTHRCLLAQEPVYHPAFAGHVVEIDTIFHPMELMAARISADVAADKIPAPEQPFCFRTQWGKNINLGDVIREL